MESNSNDINFMKMALKEAVKATGRTSPNPLVGAVIVKNGQVVSKGYHKQAGTLHAEVNAINNASETRGATIYVTLEPCNHQGRTPPCTHAIVKSGISRVVVGMVDPNPVVSGGGIKYLKSMGVDVCCGVLEEKCQNINLFFIKWIKTGLPWVILKAGLTLDGKIASRCGNGGWITNKKSRKHVHKMRDRVDGILIGIGTALADDPSLTTRLSGAGHRDPARIILDSNLRLPIEANMLIQESDAPTYIFCGVKHDPDKKQLLEKAGATVVPVDLSEDGHIDLEMVLKELGNRQITSLLVEGGSIVHGAFLSRNLIDQVSLFFGPLLLGGDGLSAVGDLKLDRLDQAKRLHRISSRQFDDDILIEGYLK